MTLETPGRGEPCYNAPHYNTNLNKPAPFYSISKQGANDKYRGMFETQKSGNKTSSRKIGLDIRTHASPNVGQDQVPGGVSVLCWHAAPVANVLWKIR